MNDQQVDELLKVLDRALAVEPSPSVAASARMRFDEQRPVQWRLMWLPAMAGLALAVLVVCWRLLPLSPALLAPTSKAPTAELQPASPSMPAPRVTAEVKPGGHSSHVSASHERAKTLQVAAQPSFEPLVPPDERMLIGRLLANARANSVTTETRVAERPAERPLEIVPLPTLEPVRVAVLEMAPIGRLRLDDGSAQ